MAGSTTHKRAGNGSDTLYGGQGPDVLLGEAGNDFLFGGGSNMALGEADYLFGGAGADVFVIQNLASANVIQDFNRAEGDLTLLQGTGLNSFTDVLSHTTDYDGFSVITISPTENVWVIGQTSTTLQATDFAFG